MNPLTQYRVIRSVSLAAAIATGTHVLAQCPGIRPAFTWTSIGTAIEFTDMTSTFGMVPDSGRWYFGDGGQDTGLPTVTHTYSATGVNEVLLMLWFSDCPFSVTAMVAHGDGNDDCTVPIAPSFTTTQPANNLVQFTNSTTAADITLTQTWIFDDLSAPDFADSPSHFYLLPGSYAAALSVAGTDSSTLDGCVAGMVRTLAVDGNVSTCDSSLFVDFTLADFGTIQVEAEVVPLMTSVLPWDLSWDFGDQSAPLTTITTAIHDYMYPGAYQVCLHVSALDTIADDTCMVTVCHSIEDVAAGLSDAPDLQALWVYPNPSSGWIILADDRLEGLVDITVFDLLGAVEHAVRLPYRAGFRLNLNALPPGAHVLQVRSAGRTLRRRIVVQRP